MLKATEAALVNRLLTAPNWPTAVKVAAFPDQPFEMGYPQMGTGVFVRYAGLNYPKPQGNGRGYAQDGPLDFEVRIVVKDLRSHVGAYSLIELIHQRIACFMPANEPPYSFGLPGFWMSRSDLVDHEKKGGLWDWGCMFSIQSTFEAFYHGN
jgi:Gp37 protein